jgi:hypothetical protein
MKYRLGLPHAEVEALGRCPCGRTLGGLDALHLLRCRHGPETVAVHNDVVRATAGVLRESHFASKVETRQRQCSQYFTEVPPGAQHERCIPDLTYFQTGLHVAHALDVTVRQPHERGEGAAARDAEQEKNTKYAPWMAARGQGSFTPLAVETFGCLGPAFDALLRDCAAAAVSLDGVPEGPAPEPLVHAFRQRVGVALQRSQAHAVRARVASGTHPDHDLVRDEAAALRAHREARDLEGLPTARDLAGVEVDRDY